MSTRRYPPWYYAKRLPNADTLARWRKRARAMAKERGANNSCDICKRPVRQWGTVAVKHPKSLHGNKRTRAICSICAELLGLLIDIMEWHGASDNMPPEAFDDMPPGHLPDDPQAELPPVRTGRWANYIPRPSRAELIRRINANMDAYYAANPVPPPPEEDDHDQE